MPTARPTRAGIAAAEILTAHEFRTRRDNDLSEASDAPFWILKQTQSELLSEQLQAILSKALAAASGVVEDELHRAIRSGVATLLTESSEPAAVEALARMKTGHTYAECAQGLNYGLEVDNVDPDSDDMGNTLARLLAIGLANRAGIGVNWLVQRARQNDDSHNRGEDVARWADIGAVLGITPQGAAAKCFGDDESRSVRAPIEAALEPVLAATIRKRL